jgi:hypothetical protein
MSIATSFINIAKAKGLSDTKRVRLLVHCGNSTNTVANVYQVWISHAPVTNTGCIWINSNPDSNNYGQILQYTEQGAYALSDSESANLCSVVVGVGNVGVIEPELQTFVEDQVADVIVQLTASFDHSIQPVQNIAELKEIDVAGIEDKATIFIEDSHVWYSWDIDSSEADDLYNVIIPNTITGSGRWKLVLASRLDGGEF